MPNGRTIQRQFGPCPPDAIDARQTAPDTSAERPFVHIPKPIEPAKPQESPRAERPRPAPKEQPKKPQEEDPRLSIVDKAYAICAHLRRGGATTCEVQVKLFADNTIDATISLLPSQAEAVCLSIAAQTRKPGTAFTYQREEGLHWWLKLYHPLGSGNRPMANCRL